MSSYFLFALVLTLTALCYIDRSDSLVLWLSGAAVVVNAVLIIAERYNLAAKLIRWFSRKPSESPAAEIILPENPFTENERADIRAQLERLRYPRRVTVRDVLRRPENGALPARIVEEPRNCADATTNAVPSQDKGGAL